MSEKKRKQSEKKRLAESAKFYAQKPRHLPEGVYCSPWCGMGCKHADHMRAHDEGSRHAAKLGKVWKFEVWENCGWHYKLSRGQVEIYPAGKSFTAFLQTSPQFVTPPHKTPLAALRALVALVHETVEVLNKGIGAVEGDVL